MMKDYFRISWQEIKRRKLRSWLTLIGVFMGIAAIISLITLGKGLENAIEKQFSALGKDKLFIMPKGGLWGMGSSEKLTEDDLEVVRRSSGVKIATGMGYSYARVEFNDAVHYGFISGIATEQEERSLVGEAQTWTIATGRMLDEGDMFKIVLGNEFTKTGLFDKRVELGDRITVHGQEFKVVGFLQKIGSPPDDQSGIIPLEAYEEVFNAELGFLVAQSALGEDPLAVGNEIKKELRKSRNVDEGEEDFDIQTPEQFLESFSTILNIVQIVLIGIACISLLVGGIGIMNTMYTAVLQRTREIGVMKALGARNRHILFLFLIESGIYGAGGGLIGVILGISFAMITQLVFTLIVGPAFLSVEVSWLLVAGTLLFSFAVGCLSGLAPARKASRMNPVDSLRYE